MPLFILFFSCFGATPDHAQGLFLTVTEITLGTQGLHVVLGIKLGLAYVGQAP